MGGIDPPVNVRMGFWLSSFASGPRAAERLQRGGIQRWLRNDLTPLDSMSYFLKQHDHVNMHQIRYLRTLSFLSPEKCYLPIVITSGQEFTTRREALREDRHVEQLEERGINV